MLLSCLAGAGHARERTGSGEMPLLLLAVLGTSASFSGRTQAPSLQGGVDSGLSLSVYNNTGLAGTPTSAHLISELSFTLPLSAPALSAEATGTLLADARLQYSFACDFGDATYAALHVDDHLVCQQGVHLHGCLDNDKCNGVDNPLPTLSRTALPVRLEVMYNDVYAQNSNKTTELRVHVDVTASLNNDPQPSSSAIQVKFAPTLPALERQRRAMQQSLLSGWGAFYDMSYLDHVLLPHGARITLALCEVGKGAAGKCLTEARIDWPDHAGLQADLRLGPHAYDRSYNQLFVRTHDGCNVSVSAGGGERLLLLAEVAEGAVDVCANYAIVPIARTTWFRSNTASVSHSYSSVTSNVSLISFESHGLPTTQVFSSRAANATAILGANVSKSVHLAFPLLEGSVAFSSGEPASIDSVRAQLNTARAAEMARYTQFGALSDTKQAVQAAVMWQLIWNPLEAGPLAPVIRGNPWGLDRGTANDDWIYVVFDWDNHFGAYMLSLDAKELAYSALIQVVKAKTSKGFVPNTDAGVNKAKHTQPPVGSKVLLEMYKKYRESWIVELLFDDLMDWNNYFHQTRRLAPLNITCLGSAEGQMQDARFESGLDNSPMYDAPACTNGKCGPWNCNGSTCECFKGGQMQLYDVGMASMHAMDSAALAQLATAIGRREDAATLQGRANTMRDLIEAHLYDAQTGMYVNRLPSGTGAFYRRISPTSFYPMQTGGPSDNRVSKMMASWMLNSSHFCISPRGNSSGNTDGCYWGLPSIEASDPAFPELGYWRGYVWGPMAQLTYWGLQEYNHVPLAKIARRALTSQMNNMMLKQWHAHGYICENFHPAKDYDGCSPPGPGTTGAMKFYHWGALSGFIALIEAGFY